jgi:hypothetical protein
MIKITDIVPYKLSRYDIDYMAAQGMAHQNQAGQIVPLLVCRVWEHEYGDQPGVNGRAFLDGEAILWVTSAKSYGDFWASPMIEHE